MNNSKGILQKVSSVTGVVCFFLAAVCAVILYFKVGEIGMRDPISASFLASSFFFVFIGFILTVMGSANIPSFKVDAAQPDTPLEEKTEL
jgi:drug/metabolite transporter (DMT)-like permease